MQQSPQKSVRIGAQHAQNRRPGQQGRSMASSPFVTEMMNFFNKLTNTKSSSKVEIYQNNNNSRSNKAANNEDLEMADYDARTLARIQCCNCVPVRCAIILVAIFLLVDVGVKVFLCVYSFTATEASNNGSTVPTGLEYLGQKFIKDYKKSDADTARGYAIAFAVLTSFNILIRLLVYAGMSYYSCKQTDGIMDTAKDRKRLPTYMTILAVNELYFILICLLPLWIFYGWREFFVITRYIITYSTLNILLIFNWRDRFKEYHLQLRDIEFESDDEYNY